MAQVYAFRIHQHSDTEVKPAISFFSTVHQLTVLNVNFAVSVLGTQLRLVGSQFLSHGSDGALRVHAVIGRILTQLKGGLIPCRTTDTYYYVCT